MACDNPGITNIRKGILVPMIQKCYVVWVGRTPGIYETWDECKSEVVGFPEARCKGFSTLEQAEKALKDGWEKHWGKKDQKYKADIKYPDEIQKNSIVVDVSCSGPNGPMEYRGIGLKEKRIIFERGSFRVGTNNIGEFLAIVEAIRHIAKNGHYDTIYSDSQVAIGWVRNKTCKTTLERSEATKEIHAIIDEALEWLRKNKYSCKVIKWKTTQWGEIPADYGRK